MFFFYIEKKSRKRKRKRERFKSQIHLWRGVFIDSERWHLNEKRIRYYFLQFLGERAKLRNILLIAVGYTKRDVIYKWNSARQVAIAEDMKLSQFDLVANPTANYSASTTLSHSESTLLIRQFISKFICKKCCLICWKNLSKKFISFYLLYHFIF